MIGPFYLFAYVLFSVEMSGGLMLACRSIRYVVMYLLLQVFAGKKGIMSRPAISSLCLKHGCWGLLVHPVCNPVPDYNEEMIGIDVIDPDGGMIHPDKMTAVLAAHQRICAYLTIPTVSYSHWTRGHIQFYIDQRVFTVEVVNTVFEYTHRLKSMFDFDKIRELLNGTNYLRPFKVMIDCNNGAVGDYAKRIFVDELGVPVRGSVVNWEPKDVVKSYHPSQVSTMSAKTAHWADLRGSVDPDGTRCVVFGHRGFLVPPGETSPIMAVHHHAVPYFQTNTFDGIGRTFLTTSSIDEVAAKMSLNIVKTPGSWLYFKRQIDSGKISFAEDDNFNIGTSYSPSGDGIWTILMWLTLVIHEYKPVHSIITDHWLKHGHNFMTTYEFHCIPKKDLDYIMKNLQYNTFINPKFRKSNIQVGSEKYEVVKAGNFPYCFTTGTEIMYEDSILRLELSPRGLIIFKTVIAGNSGTLKIAVEVFSKSIPYTVNKQKVTKNLFKLAMKLSLVGACTGKTNADLVY